MPQIVYRVTCRRAGHPRAGLVGDFQKLKDAKEAAVTLNRPPTDEIVIEAGENLTEDEHAEALQAARDSDLHTRIAVEKHTGIPSDEFGRHFRVFPEDHPKYRHEEVDNT